jgi:hypothetical protein
MEININKIEFILKKFSKKNLLLIIKNFTNKQKNAYRIYKNELLNENNISIVNKDLITINNQNIKKILKNISLKFSLFLTIE